MDSKLISRIILLITGLLAAIFVVYESLTSTSSSIGKLYLYIAIVLAVCSLVRPRVALYLCIPTSCYIDFFKRLMILSGIPTERELVYLQIMPMVLVIGCAASVFASMVYARSFPRDSVYALISSLILSVILVASGGSTGGFLRQAGQALNMGVYSLLLFCVPVLLKTTEERIKYLNYCFLCFIPVALYMIKHYYYGLFDFEYDYLMTGLSQEVRIFTDDGHARRYFSTMNSSATVSTMLSVISLMAFALNGLDGKSKSFITKVGKIAALLLFAFSASLTLARTGWVCGLVALIAYIFMGNRSRLFIGYAFFITLFIVLIFSADYILKHKMLDTWQNFLANQFLGNTSSANAERAIVLGTMYDRLSGWRYLATQPEAFPLLGEAFGGKVTIHAVDGYRLYHDLIVNYLAKLGWLIMIAISGLGIYLLIKLHSFQFSLNKKNSEFRLTRYSLASLLGILAGGMANGAQLFNYPQNFYFWLWLSMALATYQWHRKNVFKNSVSPDEVNNPSYLNNRLKPHVV